MESKIRYCDECGEYLGDELDGKLYKFGRLVTTPHQCPKEKERR